MSRGFGGLLGLSGSGGFGAGGPPQLGSKDFWGVFEGLSGGVGVLRISGFKGVEGFLFGEGALKGFGGSFAGVLLGFLGCCFLRVLGVSGFPGLWFRAVGLNYGSGP